MTPPRPVAVAPAGAAADGIAALRAELGLPGAFPPEVLAEAEAAARAWRPGAGARRLDLPFVTVDPPGARDLDQALHLAQRPGGAGFRVTYAIADVAAFVAPGGAIDREALARATTVYLPGQRIPLHPPVLSEDAASLLPGVDRPALVWELDLDAEGALVATRLQRAVIRSRAQLDYGSVPGEVGVLLAEIGGLRRARERDRGGVSLRVPEQEVEERPDGWSVAYRVPLPAEEDNAQISLLTGMAGAQLMLDAGIGILRTQPPPEDRAFERLRRAAGALGAPWGEGVPYPEFIRGLDPALPAHAALLQEAAGVGRGAGYTAFDGAPPEQAAHFAIAAPYAHVTAPLRRLADRHALEVCAAVAGGRDVDPAIRAALPDLPAAMAAGSQRAGRAERAVVDLAEALVLAARVGETFRAVAIDDDQIQLRDPAVVAKVPGGGLPAGEEVEVVLEAADPATRTVRFTPR